MKKLSLILIGGLLSLTGWAQGRNVAGDPVKVIVIGAHPDDCELGAGGLAALYAAEGHSVKFVSLTNGDKGHQESGGGPLARRRHEEAMESGRRLGISYEILDNHDGELFPTLENRLEVIRMIREWDADVVISHRPNDYHPDHRNAAILVQDASYMVIVPNMLSSVPPLKKNPVFLYMRDRFQRPNPHRPDIAVDIATVFPKKLDALDAHVSQFYEWLPWTSGKLGQVPSGKKERKEWLESWVAPRYNVNDEIRQTLSKWYGAGKSSAVKMAETFEITEYGSQPDEAEVRRLFPMLKK
ncbi:MAG: GlcNAc-PI de-N-acetylase [Cytophagaceae bacterium SCN 52-12]|nr:MAG: GlcNAc-PI de-N-acetylase [Cytophagaceae bacterium SCN 52-12]